MLSETIFKEASCCEIKSSENQGFIVGLHTINMADDVIVIDGIRMFFVPLIKTSFF